MNRVVPHLVGLAFCSLFARAALATENTVKLRYVAPPECPPETEFKTALETRGATLEARAGVRALGVEIQQDSGVFRGTLRVESVGESSSTREVHASDCSEVVKGLAVVAAIALGAEQKPSDADASTPAEPAPPPKESAPAPSPPPPSTDEPRRLRGNSFKREREIEVKSGTLHVDRVEDVTLAAGASFSLIPGLVVPRYDLTMRVTHFITPPGGESRLIGPTVEVNVNMLGPQWRPDGDVRTQVFGFGAGVRACSALTYDSQGFSMHFCSEFGMLLLQLDTYDADGKRTQQKTTGLGIGSIGLDFQYNLGKYFHVSARGAGQIQVGGASAERPDGRALFKVPLFGGYAVAGVGVHF